MALIGLADLHYAIMTIEDTATTPPVYGTPKRIIGINTLDITPENDKATLYGDNQALDTKFNTKKYSVKINTAKLPLEDRAALLGHSYDSTTKKISVSAGDSAPNVAMMFDSDTENGKKWYTVFYKGKFAPATENQKTRGENLEHGLHSLEGEFVARIDNKKVYEIKEAEDTDTTTATSFYASVGGGI